MRATCFWISAAQRLRARWPQLFAERRETLLSMLKRRALRSAVLDTRAEPESALPRILGLERRAVAMPAQIGMNPASGPDLRDIHLPAAPGWWPPAPGWWIVAAIVLRRVVYLCVKVYLYTKRRRLHRAVMGDWIAASSAGTTIRRNSPRACPNSCAVSRCARRRGLRAYRGEQWMTYLDEQAGTDQFSRGVGRALLEAPYDPHATYDSLALVALVRRFARNAIDRKARHA